MGCDFGQFSMCSGEVFAFAYDVSDNIDALGAALVSGEWVLVSGESVRVDGQGVDGNLAVVTLSAIAPGRSILTCLATYSDGQKSKAKLVVKV